MLPHQLQISNGIRLHWLFDDRFKTNHLTVQFLVPLAADTVSGYALLLSVLGHGCERYPTLRLLNEALAELYAASITTRVQKRGECQVLSFDVSFLDNAFVPDDTDVFGGTLEVLKEIIFHPLVKDGAFDPQIVSLEQKNMCDAIRAQINNKTIYAYKQGIKEMCRNEAYGLDENGTIEGIEKLTPKDLYTYYQTLLQSAPIEIYYVGRMEISQFSAHLGHAFEAQTRGTLLVPSTQVVRHAQAPVHRVTQDMPVNQGKLTVGFRTGKVLGDADYYKLSVMNEIFGGSPSSRLFMNVREKLSLCYYCSSSTEALKGLMTVISGVENEKKEEAEAEILRQLHALQTTQVTQEELENAKRSLCNAYREISDDAASMIAWYSQRVLAGVPCSFEQAIGQIQRVTPQDVLEAARAVSLDTVYFLHAAKGTVANDEEEKTDG